MSEGDEALCRFAERLTSDQHGMGQDDVDVLRSHGFDDRAVHDATQVIAYFNYITRIADGLGVEVEDFILPWGQEPGPGGQEPPNPDPHGPPH